MNRSILPIVCAFSLVPTLVAQSDLRGISFTGAAYALSSATGTGIAIGTTGAAGLNSMARYGSLLLSVTSAGALVAINPFNGAAGTLVTTSPALTSVRGLATTPSGVLYAIQDGGLTTVPDKLYTIDVTTGLTTFIGNCSHNGLQGFASDLAGNLYAWDLGPGTGVGVGLVVVDALTGATTDVNPAVGNTVDIQTLATAPSGVLFGGRNSLYTVDTSTGVVTLVGAGGFTDLRGMEFVPAAGCSQFNGSGVNPLVCSCASLPVLATPWNITVTPAATTVATLVFFSTTALPVPVPLFGGEALIAPPVVDIGTAVGAHTLLLPQDASLAGLGLFGQGLRLNALPAGLSIELTNAISATLGF